MKVYVFLADGFEEIEALTVVDVLRRAEIDTVSVSISGKHDVAGAHNIIVKADMLFDESKIIDGDMIVLPGGMPGALNLQNHVGITEIIHMFNKSNNYIAAICAAPMILGKLGILNGKKATCYPSFEKDLIGADVQTASVVQDGKIITSRGAGTAMEFSLKLVEVIKGTMEAEALRSAMLV